MFKNTLHSSQYATQNFNEFSLFKNLKSNLLISHSKLITLQSFLGHISLILTVPWKKSVLPPIKYLHCSFIQQTLTGLFGWCILWAPFTRLTVNISAS